MTDPRVRPSPLVQRKRRTREHVIADLSANHVERFVLRCGFAAETTRHDYGIDMILFFYGDGGEIRNGQVMVQLKAADEIKTLRGGTLVAHIVKRKDLEYWLDIAQPVILTLYDAAADRAYWLYVQAYFEARKGFRLSKVGERITVHVPVANVVDESAIRRFARFNDDVVRQQRGKVRHHE